jgi:hypothetical protein
MDTEPESSENIPLREERGGPNWARIKKDIKAEVLLRREKPPKIR